MIIDANIKPYVVGSEATLREALTQIGKNFRQAVLLVSPKGVLEGIITDGDVRRWLISEEKPDPGVPVSSIMNRSFFSAHINTPKSKIERIFSHRIKFVPLVDDRGRLVAIARPRGEPMKVGELELHPASKTFIIAEIGNNHNGSLELAKKLVDEAVEAGADCAKFQMRDLDSLHRNQGNSNDPRADLGDQYTLDLLSRFQLTPEEHFRIFDYCKEKGIFPLCTPFDEKSVDRLEEYGIGAYKVASADLTNHPLLEKLSRTGKPLFCSTGMSEEAEIRSAVAVLKKNGAQYALLHCNSTYPAPLKDINLNYIDRIAEIGECLVGYSGHELGINVALAAVSKGAKVIEKHFTLDRAMEGNDHRVSLLPHEFKAMVGAIREIEEALGSSRERTVTQGEKMNREILSKSLVITQDLASGETIEDHMISIKSPGQGLPPYRKQDLVGRRARRNFKAGDFFFPDDIAGESMEARTYRFGRPFGIPVRYHDVAEMISKTNLDLVEFHLSYKDMELDPAQHLTGTYPVDFVVHAPELFANDHILDLCAEDETYRARSVREMQRVIDLTRSLKGFFPNASRPRIIVNVGGFTEREHLPHERRVALYETLSRSLRELDREGIELIPQTMPPFPWHFGGRRHHNLFVDPGEIVEFCTKENMRVCLDLSHSALAANYYKWPFHEFIEKVGPYAAHLHVVDASGVDGEGLQIGEGDIDFAVVGKVLKTHAPQASFIPEIWQGHKNNGAGFWLALDRLEEHLN